tara:strand:- start:5174 stop:5380 length:207 start_codon:yes stop_codon:yes gene_type:complete
MNKGKKLKAIEFVKHAHIDKTKLGYEALLLGDVATLIEMLIDEPINREDLVFNNENPHDSKPDINHIY